MKINSAEKLILVMLSEIYEKLGIRGEIDPAFVKTAIYSNQLWGWKHPGLFDSDPEPTPPVVKEVVDILDMWNFLESAYRSFSPAEQETVTAEAEPIMKEVKFRMVALPLGQSSQRTPSFRSLSRRSFRQPRSNRGGFST